MKQLWLTPGLLDDNGLIIKAPWLCLCSGDVLITTAGPLSGLQQWALTPVAPPHPCSWFLPFSKSQARTKFQRLL